MLKTPLTVQSVLRDWRSGELTLLSLALVIAVACVSALNIFAGMVNQQLVQQASQMLGADLVVRSSVPISSQWFIKAKELGLKQTTTLTFLSMVAHNDNLQLAQIRSIEAPYPLLGELKIANTLSEQARSIHEVPANDTVWLSPLLLPLLNVAVGGKLTIGAAEFTVAALLIEEPGQTGDWFNISPRIIMNQGDIPKTKVVQPGSNLAYRWLLTGEKNNIEQLKYYLKDKLTEQQELADGTTNLSVTQTIQRTLDYLNLGTLMSLVLAGVAISMASLRYSQRHTQQVAILRCFGASQRQIIGVYLSGILFLGFISCLLGVLLGYILQPLLRQWLSGLLPQFKASLTIKPALLSITTGMVVLLCFSLMNILKLRHVTAVTILRKEKLAWTTETWLGYSLAFLLLAGLAYFYTQSWRLTVSVLYACLGFIAVVTGSLWLIFNYLTTIKHYIHLNWRFGFANIARNLANSSLQVIGIGLALTAILSLYILRNDLIHNWQQQLSDTAANYFIVNIEPNQVEALTQFLAKNNIKTSNLYPMVRGRVIAINGQRVQRLFGEKMKEINALQREINLSWTSALPPNNKIVAGSWPVADKEENWVSIEQGVADQLGLKLNDVMTFRIGITTISTKVTSIRTVDWAAFTPNFFMLFRPGLLNDFPQTYIASIYLKSSQQKVLNTLVTQFPNVTIIDIANILNKIHSIFDNTSKAINFMAFFGALAGLIIVILAMLSFSGLKQQETQILKILGIGQRQLIWIQSSESLIIGFYAGLLAVTTATLINQYLATFILDIVLTKRWHFFIIVPIMTAFLTFLVNSLVLLSQYQKQRLTRLYQGL
ncbi:TPA: ABC transporter permease [Legionella feeleii]